jgi:hypothetical protein
MLKYNTDVGYCKIKGIIKYQSDEGYELGRTCEMHGHIKNGKK